MNIRKYMFAGLLAVAGTVLAADRASAQVSFGPGGVSIMGSGGSGVVVPLGGSGSGQGLTFVSPGGAYNPQSGNIYTPAYNTPYGGTSYYSPRSGSFYNPTYGNYNAPAVGYSNPYGYGYTNPGYGYSNPYGYSNSGGYSNYGGYAPGTYWRR